MFKRIIWFTAGAAAGVAGVRRVEREISERRSKLEPESLANSAVEVAGRSADRVRAALEDGRREMRRVTHELESSHDPSRRPPRPRALGSAGTGSSVATPSR
ncbi:MAG TPA: hypothetical protein VFN21_05245 [Acidimicrobiales bacterium]|nr:hypothetical protein [Acidimicrobiales bacterium]